MLLLIIFVLLIIVLIKFFKNTKIKWGTLFKKGVVIEKGKWGVACYCGKQGSSKSASCIEWILNNVSKDYPLYANSKTIKGLEYTYFNGLQG